MRYETAKLSDICEFLYGEGLVEAQRRGGEYPVYGSNGIVGWHDQAITKGPTIIVGRKGSIGEVHFSKIPCWPIDTTYHIQLKNKPCDLNWLYYVLLALDLTKLNKSAAVPGLNRNDAYEKEFPYPPLDEQKRIAAILSKADRLRRLRRYARELSDSYLQSVFLEMFGDPVANPRGWKTTELANLCEITRGASPRPIKDYLGGTISWIKIGDATQGDDLYITSTEDHVTREGAAKSVFLKSGSIVFANCGVSLGFARILKIDGCIHDGWLSLAKLDETRMIPLFLLKILNQMTLYLRSLAPEGTQPNLNTGIMKKVPIILPPLPLQQKFAQIVQKTERLRTQQRESERQAEHLFQSLLDRAFRGEI